MLRTSSGAARARAGYFAPPSAPHDIACSARAGAAGSTGIACVQDGGGGRWREGLTPQPFGGLKDDDFCSVHDCFRFEKRLFRQQSRAPTVVLDRCRTLYLLQGRPGKMRGGGINSGAGYCNWAVLVDGLCVCARALSQVHLPAPNPPPPTRPPLATGRGGRLRDGRGRGRGMRCTALPPTRRRAARIRMPSIPGRTSDSECVVSV